jgi:hypothetical protein
VGISVIVIGTRIAFAFNRRRLVVVLGVGTIAGYACLASVLAAVKGVTGLAFAFTVVSLIVGCTTLAVVMGDTAVGRRDVMRNWVCAPILLSGAFLAGALAGRLVAPATATVTSPAVSVLLSFGLGAMSLLGAILLFRPSEYDLVRRTLPFQWHAPSRSPRL